MIRVTSGIETRDGAGVKLTRIIGSPELDMWDPFLLFDRFESEDPDDYIAGFPPHPHRGFETVTYLLAGRLRHKDSTGREGVIEPGGVQWMTAARGIVHSEMPEQVEGRLAGYQLWINLPAADKMSAPAYQEFGAGEIPLIRRDSGAEIRLIAGTTGDGVSGPVRNVPTAPLYLDVCLAPAGTFLEHVPKTHGCFVHVVYGAIDVIAADPADDATVGAGALALLDDGDRIALRSRKGQCRLLLVAGIRLGEPVARSGPFVMNTREEVIRAYDDFRGGRF